MIISDELEPLNDTVSEIMEALLNMCNLCILGIERIENDDADNEKFNDGLKQGKIAFELIDKMLTQLASYKTFMELENQRFFER